MKIKLWTVELRVPVRGSANLLLLAWSRPQIRARIYIEFLIDVKLWAFFFLVRVSVQTGVLYNLPIWDALCILVYLLWEEMHLFWLLTARKSVFGAARETGLLS